MENSNEDTQIGGRNATQGSARPSRIRARDDRAILRTLALPAYVVGHAEYALTSLEAQHRGLI